MHFTRAAIAGLAVPACVLATLAGAAADAPAQPISQQDDKVVTYEPAFFDRYQPVTALDMIERVPGFQLVQGGGQRGFAGAAGNVLINGERPSTKRDSAAEILGRIAATQVKRVDLIRGQAAGLDVRGQSVVVNVVLEDDAGPAVRWQASVEQDTDSGGPTPIGEASLTDRWAGTRVTVGLEVGKFFFGNPATERVFANGAVIEDRDEIEKTEGHFIASNLNAESLLDHTVLHTNANLRYQAEDFLERSDRIPRGPMRSPRTVLQGESEDELSLELGADAERGFGQEFNAKAIGLYRFAREDSLSSERLLDAAGQRQERRVADVLTESSESILRVELDWTGWADHTVEASAEGAFNTLDNALALTVDTGDGPRQVPVPGSNTRVEELRGDYSLSDAWSMGDFLLETGVAAENSTITQTGSAGNERSFFFVKPSLSLSYSPSQHRQSRLRFDRDVAQLDFNDFVSATNFADDDLDLGNPDLRPESTWILALSHERRFGDIGVATLTVFHHWVDDVQDLLPVGATNEVPGNIGDGRRYGIELESTLPLDKLGLSNARLDLDSRWQSSTVTDPVTGRSRVFSGEREFDVELEYRQDFEAQRWAWGWALEFVGEQPAFGVDEIDTFDRGTDLEAFIESTRWLGVKIRLTAQNILDRRFSRDRRVFTGPRDSAGLDFRELRDRRRRRSIILSVSGTF